MANGAKLAGLTTTARTPAARHPWRVVISAAILLAVINLVVIGLHFSDTSDQGRQHVSADVEQVSPAPGSLASPQDDIEVRLRTGFTGVIVFDGKRLPEDQLTLDNATSTVAFRPGPGKDITRLRAGTHAIAVLYWEQGKPEPAHPKSYAWSFRAAA
jgi:hypothetical protein